MDGTRDLTLLRSGIREIVTLKLRDPGFLTERIFNLTCNGIESHYNANGALVDLKKKNTYGAQSLMESQPDKQDSR